MADWSSFYCRVKLVCSAACGHIGDTSGSNVEFVQGAEERSKESVALLVSNPAFLVLVEVIPG